MNFNNINIGEELIKEKEKKESLLSQVAAIFSASVKKDSEIVSRIRGINSADVADSSILDEEDRRLVFEWEHIRKVCIRYHLRFLDASCFKADIPYEAVIRIKELESKYNVTFRHFKIVAPGAVFNLQEANQDPLLFAGLSDNSFLLIHKWGRDLAWYRSLLYYPVRSIYTYFKFMWVPAGTIAFSIPFQWLMVTPDREWPFRFWLTIHCFIALFFFVLFVFSSTGKSFSDMNWKSRYHAK